MKDMSKTNSDIRDEVKQWLNRTYLGPLNFDDDGNPDLEETVNFSPKDLYTTGILYPRLEKVELEFDDVENDIFLETERDDNPEQQEDFEKKKRKKRKLSFIDDEEEELRLTTEFNPSSIAVSCILSLGSHFKLNCSFGKYFNLKDEDSSSFKRSHYDCSLNVNLNESGLIIENEDENWSVESNRHSAIINSKLTEAKIKIVARGKTEKTGRSSRIITVSLINNLHLNSKEQRRIQNCIFQPKINIHSKSGFEPLEDKTDLNALTEEEIDIKFLYRHYQNYGMGHGCSVNWSKENEKVVSVESEMLPTEEIKGVDFDPEELRGIDEILFMKNLTDCDTSNSVDIMTSRLEEFVGAYSSWIDNQYTTVNKLSLNNQFTSASKRLLSNCEALRDRMLKGVQLLKEPTVLRAFLDANKAMFYQRILADFSKHRLREGRVLSNDDSKDDPLPDFDSIPYDSKSGIVWSEGIYQSLLNETDSKWYMAKWRPFQLAFLLSQIQGVVDKSSDDRNTVDLLWFATGGGKTEAYLGLIAFNIFFNRLSTTDDVHGVNVMMRYTLRMLNKQQFSRANVLICSCEIIRFRNSETYGKTRISNGLWVGGSLTPNKQSGQEGNIDLLRTYKNHIENKKDIVDTKNYSPPVFSCPCCGNKLVKEVESDKLLGRWGYHQVISKFKNKPFTHNDSSSNPFYMHCTNTKCHYYIASSEFKLTTNDNSRFVERTLPIYYVDEEIYDVRPTLLFSTVDKYAQLAWKKESFKLFNYDENFDRACSPPSLIIQDELHLISSSLGTIYSLFEFVIDELCTVEGVSPKVVGATATVRNAKQQCINIYNRKKYAQFPPSGISIDDSFYSRKKEIDDKARVYVGVMPSGFTSTTAKLRLDSLLIEGINSFTKTSHSVLDNYYTLLAYFNTVKELGKYRTLLEDDMVAYRKFLCSIFNTHFSGYIPDRIIELSSQMNADQINTGLEVLEKVRLHKIDEEDEIILFLNSIGIRSLKDLELTKYKKGWSWSWLHIILNNWESISKICSLSEDMRVSGFPKKENQDEIIKVNKLIEHCCNRFESAMSTRIEGDVKDPIKVAMATNMISVGVDIPRLNVMSIAGQPKTTAEYIQASSRVGREVPGIVFTLYNQAKNRDRSHYESFKDYHQAYYRHVEATSVTPFSLPALEKTIDSILIALSRVRHFKSSDSAELTPKGEELLKSIGTDLVNRFVSIQNELETLPKDEMERRKAAIEELIDDSINKWKSQGKIKFTTFYDAMKLDRLSEDNLNSVLFMDAKYRSHHLTQEKLFAMTSLRDVDTSSKVKIKSYI